MLRISVDKDTANGVIRMKIEGRLTGDGMDQVSRTLETLAPEKSRVVIDLAAVGFADKTALARLRALPAAGAELTALSPFLRELLATTLDGSDGAARPTHRADNGGDTGETNLLAQLRAGDEAAYETIVRRYGPRLLATAKRFMRSEEEAAEVVQDAYLSAFRAIDDFGGEARISTWLHRIVVNAALMRLRSQKRRREERIDDLIPCFDDTGHFAEPPTNWGATAEDLLSRKDSHAMVRAAIGELPDTYRVVLLLRDIEERDAADVAEALGITPNAVKVRLHRARQALRTLIDRKMKETGA